MVTSAACEPELRDTKGDIIAARIEVPILVVMIEGIIGKFSFWSMIER